MVIIKGMGIGSDQEFAQVEHKFCCFLTVKLVGCEADELYGSFEDCQAHNIHTTMQALSYISSKIKTFKGSFLSKKGDRAFMRTKVQIILATISYLTRKKMPEKFWRILYYHIYL